MRFMENFITFSKHVKEWKFDMDITDLGIYT